MRSPQQTIVDDLLAAYRAGRRLILLFDYDGTLAPIAPHPWLARLDRRRRRLLEDLTRYPRVHLGIVSGRPIDQLKDILCLSNVCLAGTSGLELDLYGLRLVHPQARLARGLIARIAQPVAAAISATAGAWLENKGLGFTVHFRHVPSDLIEPLRTRVGEILEPFAGKVRCTDAPMAMEITAALGWDKGTAVWAIVHHLKACDDALLYAGDSANDAEALQTTVALGGIGIEIGPEAPPVAKFHLRDPADLHELLSDLLTGLNCVGRTEQSEARRNSRLTA